MENKHNNKPELFVDNERYDWNKETINGAEIRELAGVPDDVQIFHKIPGSPDIEVSNDTVIDLEELKGPDRFSTQSVGSQAG